MASGDVVGWGWVIALWTLDWVQMVSMPLGDSPGLPWRQVPLMSHGIHLPLLALTFVPGNTSATGPTYPVTSLFIVACVYSTLLLALVAWSTAIHFGAITYRPLWRVRLQRWLFRVGVHSLTIPIFAALASPWSCRGGIQGETWTGTQAAVSGDSGK